MFSGIGGFEHAIQNAYRSKVRGEQEDSERDEGSGLLSKEREDPGAKDGWSGQCFADESNEGPLCVGYSEIDKYASKVYERNFNGTETISSNREQQTDSESSGEEQSISNQGEQSNQPSEWGDNISNGGHHNYGDATKINASELPDFDLLVGGFPCQAFSVAGKRAGFDDTRGTLFFDIARILKEKRPRHLVLENVKGLLSHDQGRTFTTIIGVLTDLGYCVEWQVLNSKNFGVPQNRERVFIVGHLRGECGRKILPLTQANREDIVQLNQPRHSNDRLYADQGLSPTLNTMQGGNRQPFVSLRVQGDLDKRKMYISEISATLAANPTSDNTARATDGARIRRLTPVECERLQGFPDNWTQGESDTQRYKMCGNAVTTSVVEKIINEMR
jgi:DNA (cytosine-5)-methyltransferase 1